MEIKCTKEEFKVLLDLVYAGNLLINGMREVDERIAPHAELEQKIFAMAKEFGLEDYIEFDETTGFLDNKTIDKEENFNNSL